MKTIYFDVFAGISGDMCLGALIDAGCPGEEIKSLLSGMKIPGFDLKWERVMRGPLSGTKADVIVEEEAHSHRKLSGVLEIVDSIKWPGDVRNRIEEVFTALAHAEGHVHNKPYDQIHFHEVGCYDAIVDISGTLLGLHLLGVESCASSRVHVGAGFAQTRHGALPLPAPATANLLKGFTLFSTGINMEMVTPTGAALLRVLTGGSSHIPTMNLETIGYGAGTRNSKELPGMLRIFIGESGVNGADSVTVIETNIDDMNPEFFNPMMDSLFKAGALDVSLTPLMMKKGRPGTKVSVIVPPAQRETIAQAMIQNSSSIGVRMYDCERRIMNRKSCSVETTWGTVRGKICAGHGVDKRFTPEYEDCLRIHKEQKTPIAQVYQAAATAFEEQN